MINKSGIIVDSLRLPLREGLKKAKEMGADGVQIFAVKGEMDPENLSSAQRQELRRYIEDLGLEISALCGDLGGHGFQSEVDNPAKIEKSKRIIDLALDLGTNIVTTHIGIVPEDNERVYETMQKACEELSIYAYKSNAHFAVETGPETAIVLKSFLDTLTNNGVAVNFDPANMVMVTGDDPVEGVKLLKNYIVHTHVKDGYRLLKVDPKLVYGFVGLEKELRHEELAKLGATGPLFRETPLGEGNVDFENYFKALIDIGYTGYLTIEREVGEDPVGDIEKALAFIQKYKVLAAK